MIKLEEFSDKHFVSPIVITVKKDGSIKLALKSKEFNKQIHKNKYQMPKIKELMDGINLIIAKRKDGEVYFTTLDLTYAYRQVALEAKTSEQCNLSLVGVKSTGTYRFKNGFYGLTTLTAELQKVMDTLIKNFLPAHAFVDDILIVSKVTKIEDLLLIQKGLKKVDVANASLKLQKCKFAKLSCQWLGYNISNNGITPLIRKTKAIDELKPLRSRRKIKSLMGSLHSFA